MDAGNLVPLQIAPIMVEYNIWGYVASRNGGTLRTVGMKGDIQGLWGLLWDSRV